MKKKIKAERELIELFVDELKEQSTNFKKYLEEVKESGLTGLNLDELLRISHSIKGAAKLICLNEIADYGNSLEDYFKALKEKKILFKEDHLLILEEAYLLLNKIAHSSFDELEGILEEKKKTFEKIEDQLAKFQTLADDSNKNDAVETFLEDLKKETEVLVEGIINIRQNFDDLETLKKMADTAETIKIKASHIDLPIVIQVGEALENCFKTAFHQQLTWTQGHLDLVLESIEFLRKLSQCNSYNIKSWLTINEKGIEAIAAVIFAISREASAIPLRKKETSKSKSKNVGSNLKKPSTSPADPDTTMLDLFYGELDQRVLELNEGILKLEVHSRDKKTLESLMRAAHSLKGAARIVEFEDISKIAHVLEDFFSLLEKEEIKLTSGHIDILLKAVDLFSRLSQVSYYAIDEWINVQSKEIESVIRDIVLMTLNPHEIPQSTIETKKNYSLKVENLSRVQKDLIKESEEEKRKNLKNEIVPKEKNDSFLRVSAKNLNRLMGLAGESLVESGWLIPFSKSLTSLKVEQNNLSKILNKLYELSIDSTDRIKIEMIEKLKKGINKWQWKLSERLIDLDLYIQRQENLSNRLYTEVINSRMRPFADGIESFPRIVRDLAKQLKKKVRFVVEGKSTAVDREILEKLESPLNHLIRNAVDHGIETPSERIAKGKNEEGIVKIIASHKAGMLSIIVSDDGRGINLEELKNRTIEKGFVSASLAEKLTESELLEFIFLPGFSTSEHVTNISGRGIGLNVVLNMIEEVGGSVHASLNDGLVVELQLPLTLSVIRALLVEISGEPYAFPLARLDKVILLPKNQVQTIENKFYFNHGKKNIGLVQGFKFLELPSPELETEDLSVVVVSDQVNTYGVIVDRFLEEKELVVQELPPEIGKVQDISGGAFMENGSPVLIIDVEDMIKSIDRLLAKDHYK